VRWYDTLAGRGQFSSSEWDKFTADNRRHSGNRRRVAKEHQARASKMLLTVVR
jgi:hypothetical protein